jgi:hypothetical protein
VLLCKLKQLWHRACHPNHLYDGCDTYVFFLLIVDVVIFIVWLVQLSWWYQDLRHLFRRLVGAPDPWKTAATAPAA